MKNWPAYEAALRKRGDITVWFDEDAIDAWNAPPGGRSDGWEASRTDARAHEPVTPALESSLLTPPNAVEVGRPGTTRTDGRAHLEETARPPGCGHWADARRRAPPIIGPAHGLAVGRPAVGSPGRESPVA